jgi:hypothetical protein
MNCRCREQPQHPSAPTLTKSCAKLFGVALIMEYRNDQDFCMVLSNGKINGIRPLGHPNFSSQLSYTPIFFRIVCHSPQKDPKGLGKPLAQARLPLIVPLDGLPKFCFRFRGEKQLENHSLKPNSFLISAATCSKGIQRSGCSLASFERRSNSASCSGVSSSSAYSSQSLSINSRCSGLGRFRICSRMSVALMDSVYQTRLHRQVSVGCNLAGNFFQSSVRAAESRTDPGDLINVAPRGIDQKLVTSSLTLPEFGANLFLA